MCAQSFPARKSFDRSTWMRFSIIIPLSAGTEVTYQLSESVYSYCLLPAKTLRLPVTHTHTDAHMYTLCHTCCHCVTRGGCEADTCSDMMVSVEVAALAVCRLPRRELVDSGAEWTEQKPVEWRGVTGFLLEEGGRNTHRLRWGHNPVCLILTFTGCSI